jgi:cysteine desulfuration protein SufE
MQSIDDIREEYEFLDGDDRYRLLIDLGRQLEPMPDPLKTDATLVRGCSASVWVYPQQREDGSLHFIALVLATVEDQPAQAILDRDIDATLAPFDLRNQLSSNRTQGIPNMIALIRETAARLA